MTKNIDEELADLLRLLTAAREANLKAVKKTMVLYNRPARECEEMIEALRADQESHDQQTLREVAASLALNFASTTVQ